MEAALDLDHGDELDSAMVFTVRIRSYLCCSAVGVCKTESENSLFMMSAITLHTARIVAAIALILYFNSRLRVFALPRVYVENVTATYTLPPFFLTETMPTFLRIRLNNIKLWTKIELARTLFVSCFFFNHQLIFSSGCHCNLLFGSMQLFDASRLAQWARH